MIMGRLRAFVSSHSGQHKLQLQKQEIKVLAQVATNPYFVSIYPITQAMRFTTLERIRGIICGFVF